MTTFGLNRRLRGASVGQLCALEMTSSLPCAALADGLRRLGHDGDATLFFDEHVEADAVHEQLAAREICGTMVSSGDVDRAEVLFGAVACLVLDARQSEVLMSRWEKNRSRGESFAARAGA
jgi:hypothetical protein